MASGKVRWGDTLDEDDILPPRLESGPDAKGIKTIIDYRKNEKGETVKMTTRIRVSTVQKKIYAVCRSVASFPGFP
jgi:translation initiation factor 3 subunit G